MTTTSPSNSGPLSLAEETLRMIASLPAPEGLEERVSARLHTPRNARLLHWPLYALPGNGYAGNWIRGAAAAAIVFVVAGGGWRVYSHVQSPQPGRVLAMPPRVGASAGFSSAGAMRTPETLNPPILSLQGKSAAGASAQAAQGANATVHRHRAGKKTGKQPVQQPAP